MNFHKSFKKYSILTSNIRKQPQSPKNQLKRQIEIQQWMNTRGTYMYIYGKILIGIPKLQFSQNIDVFRQKDSQGL